MGRFQTVKQSPGFYAGGLLSSRKKCLSSNLKGVKGSLDILFSKTNPVIWKAKYYFDLSVQNNYHHLHKGNNSSKQLQFVMFKNKLLTICLIKFYYVRLFCV